MDGYMARTVAVLAATLAFFGAVWVGTNGGQGAAGEGQGADPPAERNEAVEPGEVKDAELVWPPPRFEERRADRAKMVATLRDSYGMKDRAILRAMAAVPRHLFVPRRGQSGAYADRPLPIGHGQTISQPFMVAEMTRLLELQPGDRVLEIGTGSGYQAAVLTEFTPHVYTVEIVKPLLDSAAERLEELGYTVVRAKHGDGFYGWEEHAPFDAIIVTCAAGQIPPPLLRQLAPGGRMVIPVGPVHAVQSLMMVNKDEEGDVRSRSVMPVRFVPLVRSSAMAGRGD